MSRKNLCQMCRGSHLTNKCLSKEIVLALRNKKLDIKDVVGETNIDYSRVHNWYHKNTGIMAYDLMLLLRTFDFVWHLLAEEFKLSNVIKEHSKLSLKSGAFMSLDSKNMKVLDAIFAKSLILSVLWVDIEKLFRACGCTITECQNSRIWIELNGVLAVFHLSNSKKLWIKKFSVQRFLEEAGVKYESVNI